MQTNRGIRCQKNNWQPVAGLWDFDGACRPGGPGEMGFQSNFSVGVFQWVARSNGKGVKRGSVAKRITGHVGTPEDVYARAESFCRTQEAIDNLNVEGPPDRPTDSHK